MNMYICVCVNIYIYIFHTYGNLLEWFTGWVQQSLTVNRKSKNLVVARSHEAGCLSWSSVCAKVPKKQAPMPVQDWMSWQGEDKQMNKPFFFPCSYIGFQQKGCPRLKVFPPASRTGLKMFIIQLHYLEQRPVVFPPQDPEHKRSGL